MLAHVVVSKYDDHVPLQPLEEKLQTTALVAGTERYPWLKELIPPRPGGAVTCTLCKGSGRLDPEQHAFCWGCGALGWRLGGQP